MSSAANCPECGRSYSAHGANWCLPGFGPEPNATEFLGRKHENEPMPFLREAFRLGTQTERYSGGGWLKQRYRGLRWAWNEALFRLGIGGIA